MGHTLALQSREGVGSRFLLTLPRVQADTSAPEPTDAERQARRTALQGLRVLVIDDESRVLPAMQHLLQPWRSLALVAATIEDALALADSGTPDALIADFRLGGDSTGFDAVRRLRQRCGALPAAIFTGDTEAHWQQATATPDVPVLQKPVRPEEIAH